MTDESTDSMINPLSNRESSIPPISTTLLLNYHSTKRMIHACIAPSIAKAFGLYGCLVYGLFSGLVFAVWNMCVQGDFGRVKGTLAGRLMIYTIKEVFETTD